MARFWWFAAALVLALLIVTTDCLRGPATHVEAREPTFKRRGGSRFSTKAEEGLETTPVPFTTTSRSNRRNTNRNAVPSTERPSENIHEMTTLKSRRDRDRNIGLSKETTRSVIFKERSTEKSEARRRTSQFRTQLSEPDNDLVRAATEDRRYLPESKNSRPKKIARDVELEVPFDNSRNVQKNRIAPVKPKSEDPNDGNHRSYSPEFNLSRGTSRVLSSESRRSRINNEDIRSSNIHASRRSSLGDVNESAESNEKIVENGRTSGKRFPERSSNLDGVTSFPTKSNTMMSQRKEHRRRSGRRGPPEIEDGSVTESSSTRRRTSEQRSRGGPENEFKSGRVDRRSETSRRLEEPEKSKVNTKLTSSGGKVKSEPTTGSRERSTRTQSEIKLSPPVASETVTTNIQDFDSTTLPNLRSTVSTNRNRVAVSSLASKIVPNNNVSNHGSGFRGRKNGSSNMQHTENSVNSQSAQTTNAPTRRNPESTLSRRQSQGINASTTTSFPERITNEISSSESDPEISTSPTRGRGSKFFKEASASMKKDKELDEGDNYPAAFKAKLAQLKEAKVSKTRLESPPRIGENLKKHTASTDVSTKMPKKLAGSRKLIRSNSKNEDSHGQKNSPTTIRSNDVESDEPKTIKGPRTFGTSRLSSTTGKAAVTVTFPTIDKFSRTAKSISRGNVRVEGTNRTKMVGEERSTTQKLSEDQILQTIITNRPETATQGITTKPVKSRTVLSRGKGTTPKTSEVSSSTTRRTRAWNTAYIDKNWQEPIPKSSSIDAESFPTRLPGTTMKTRSWNSAHLDKNWEAPITESTTVNSDSFTTRSSSTTIRSRLWYAPHIDKNWEPRTTDATSTNAESSSIEVPTTTKRSRLWYASHTDKNWVPPTVKPTTVEANPSTTDLSTSSKKFQAKSEHRPTEKSVQMQDNHSTTRIPVVASTNKYFNRQTESSKSFGTITTPATSVDSLQPVRPREIRPRTSTYRRHSDGAAILSPSAMKDVAITPKAPKYDSLTSSEDSTQRSAKQVPALAVSNVVRTNDTNNSTGISLSSRGNSGSSNSNIFNPTKTTHLINSDASLLEQLRSTVAPLLSALGNRTPIFSGSYSNVNTNSPQRVTPSGSPPRFSARYRGAELFVRKPNGLDSSEPLATTPLTSTKDTLASPEITILSPGEPKVITFYQALESASITNEIDQKNDNVNQPKGVSQLKINSDTDANPNVTNNANNDTEKQMVTNSEPATTPAISLSIVEESRHPRPDITTTQSTAESNTTQTLSVNTEMPPSTPDPEPSTAFVPTSLWDTGINSSSGSQMSVTTQLSNESDVVTQPIQMSSEAAITISTESVTSKLDSRIDTFSDQLLNPPEENQVTTIMPAVPTEAARELESLSSITEGMTAFFPGEVSPGATVSTTGIDSPTIPGLENLSISTQTTTIFQVKQELPGATTTLQSSSTVPSDSDLAAEVEIPGTSTISPNSDTTNSLPPSTFEPLIDSIDNVFLEQMMERLMKIFNLKNMTHLQNTQQFANKSGDLGQMFGGFLDNTDRNITSEIKSLASTEPSNTVESTLNIDESFIPSTMVSMTQTDKTLMNGSPTTLVPDHVSLSEDTTVVPDIVTSFQDDVTTLEPTDMTTNPTTNSINDTHPTIVTILKQDMMETTTLGATSTPTIVAILEVTTNPPTSTQKTPLEKNPILDYPNMLAGFQDRTPVTAQETAGTEAQTTIPDSTTMSLSEIPTQSSSTSLLTSPTDPQTPIPEVTSPIPPMIVASPAAMAPRSDPTTRAPTTPYVGRFGGTRITPAPRFSSSSSTRQPLRDYHIYGIYPNKTIVRKRPEDNLIDARNIDSPYVIFGLYPDGKLVRKYPNGTVIPDPPNNPVEVVFSLSTTTNRPRPVQQSNQFNNQGTFNKNDSISNNRMFDILTSPGGQIDGFRSQLNLGLSGNALSPNGDGPNLSNDPVSLPSVGNVDNQPTSTKMIEEVKNTQVNISSNEMGGMDNPSTTSGPPSSTTPSSINPQGGRIIQDSERDKASRTKEAGGQRSTVYIGQDKFINYWKADPPSNDTKVVSVEINSMTSALNESPASSSGVLPDLGLTGNIQASGLPGSPWKEPLDQIFGIVTESPVIRTSDASNSLDEPSASRSPIIERPINPFSEVLTPMLNDAQLARDTSITTTTVVPSVSTTASTTSTTTPTTTTTTTTAATTTTMISRPATTTTALPSTSPATTTSTSTAPSTPSFTTMEVPRQTAFGTSFDDLAFLNSLLQHDGHSNSISSTPKTLTDVEQLLANKILSLALGNPGPTRSPKAIQPSNSAGNSLDQFLNPVFPSQPIIIDLLQSTARNSVASSTTAMPITWKPFPTDTSIQKIQKSSETRSKGSFTTESSSTQAVWSYFSTLPPSTKSIPIGTSTEPSLTQAAWETFPTLSPITTTTTTTSTEHSSTESVWKSFPTHPPTTSTEHSSTESVWKSFPTHPPTTSTEHSSTEGVWKFFPTHPPITTQTETPSTQAVWKSFPTHPPTTDHSSTEVVWKSFPTHPPTTTSTEPPSTQVVWKSFPTHPSSTEFSSVEKLPSTASTLATEVMPTTPKPSTSTSSKTLAANKPSSRPTPKPRTTQAPRLGFGANLLRAIFGRDVFALTTTQKPIPVKRPVQTIKVAAGTSLKPTSITPNNTAGDNAKLVELLNNSDKNGNDVKKGESSLSADDESFLRSILDGQAKVRTPSPPSSSSTNSNAAILAQLLKSQGIEPSTPGNQIRQQLQEVSQHGGTSTTRPRSMGARARPLAATTRPQSSTYPPPLFSNFNFGFQRPYQTNSEEGNTAVRNQMLNAAIGATRVFSQYLGAAITGAAQQLRSFVRNGNRLVTEAAG